MWGLQEGVVLYTSSEGNNSEKSASEGLLLTHEITNSVHEGKLVGYQCLDCGIKAIEVQAYCTKCGSSKLRIARLESRGKVLAYTIQDVSPKEFRNDAPYAWSVIELDGGVRISGWIASIKSPRDLPIGQRVRLIKSKKAEIVFEKILE